jgi:hypothetical protein
MWRVPQNWSWYVRVRRLWVVGISVRIRWVKYSLAPSVDVINCRTIR